MSIYVIVCSRRAQDNRLHRRNVLVTSALAPKHYIRIDNSEAKYGICAAYNYGVQEYARLFSKTPEDILIFMHEDAYFLQKDWDVMVQNKFAQNPNIGVLGVAGTSALSADLPLWVRAGHPYLHGCVYHQSGGKTIKSDYGESTDSGVVADGVFLAIRAGLLGAGGLQFDETVFESFHFYDLDICMQIRRQAQIAITNEIPLLHCSGGSFGAEWKRQAAAFLHKYQAQLPAFAPWVTNSPPTFTSDVHIQADEVEAPWIPM
jgi:hypothetical protein